MFSLQSPANSTPQKGMTQGHADSPRQKASGRKNGGVELLSCCWAGRIHWVDFPLGKNVYWKNSSTIKCDMFSKTGHLNLYKSIPTQKVLLPKTWIPATVAFLSSVAQGKSSRFSQRRISSSFGMATCAEVSLDDEIVAQRWWFLQVPLYLHKFFHCIFLLGETLGSKIG